MIQRIQTLYLFLAALALALLFVFPVYTFDTQTDGVAKSVKISVAGIYEKTDADFVMIKMHRPLSLMVLADALALIAIIFMYKNRKRQLTLTRVFVILLLSMVIFMITSMGNDLKMYPNVVENVGVGAFLPSVAILLTALASRSIRNDQKLIESSERIR